MNNKNLNEIEVEVEKKAMAKRKRKKRTMKVSGGKVKDLAKIIKNKR